MGLIKLENGEIIPDRRTNGARLKLDIADWVKISITIFTTFAIIIFGAGRLLTTVSAHTKILDEQCAKIDTTMQKQAKTETDITNIKENLIYIRGKIDTFVMKIK